MIKKLLFKIGLFFFQILLKVRKKKKAQPVYDTTSPVVTPSFRMNKNTLLKNSERELRPAETIEVTPENISGIIHMINTRVKAVEEIHGGEFGGAGAGGEWKDESYRYLHGNPCEESAEFPLTVRMPKRMTVSDSIDTNDINQVDPVADVNNPEPSCDDSSESDDSSSSDSDTLDSE